MKKTLIALAAVTAAGTSFAQVAVTGTLGMGYVATHTVNGAAVSDASGLGVDTSEINFKTLEDLGGGMKLAASLGFASTDRGQGATGGDTSMAFITANAGTLILASARVPDYLSAASPAAVGGNGMDGYVFDQRLFSDTLVYQYPMGPLRFTFVHGETPSIGATTGSPAGICRGGVVGSPGCQGAGVGGSSAVGLGTGAAGNSQLVPGLDNQRIYLYALAYQAGGMALDAAVATFDQHSNVNNWTSLVHVAGNYDFGSVKVGAGAEARTFTVGNRLDTLVSFNIPMGAAAFGMDWASRTVDGTTSWSRGVEGTRSGYGAQLSYNFSKSTVASLQYWNWTANIGDVEASSKYEMMLTKRF